MGNGFEEGKFRLGYQEEILHPQILSLTITQHIRVPKLGVEEFLPEGPRPLSHLQQGTALAPATSAKSLEIPNR